MIVQIRAVNRDFEEGLKLGKFFGTLVRFNDGHLLDQ